MLIKSHELCPFCGMPPVVVPISGRPNELECQNEDCCLSGMPFKVEEWNARAKTTEPSTDDLDTIMQILVRSPNCHEAVDEFWRSWKENGETHKHGYYESTWGAIRAAFRIAMLEGE